MAKFNHAFDFAFEVLSDDFYAKDVTPDMLREALRATVDRLTDADMIERCSCFDTYTITED